MLVIVNDMAATSTRNIARHGAQAVVSLMLPIRAKASSTKRIPAATITAPGISERE
jgi:hypothetical protein